MPVALGAFGTDDQLLADLHADAAGLIDEDLLALAAVGHAHDAVGAGPVGVGPGTGLHDKTLTTGSAGNRLLTELTPKHVASRCISPAGWLTADRGEKAERCERSDRLIWRDAAV